MLLVSHVRYSRGQLENPDGRKASVPSSPPTTATSGIRTTGATGAGGRVAGRARAAATRPEEPSCGKARCAPKGTRPRDLRSSFVTLRVCERVPLTQIAREVGTSVRMIEQHYAGVIANWDGKHVCAERSIPAARKNSGRKWTELLMSTER
jgi:hypothetical protein